MLYLKIAFFAWIVLCGDLFGARKRSSTFEESSEKAQKITDNAESKPPAIKQLNHLPPKILAHELCLRRSYTLVTKFAAQKTGISRVKKRILERFGELLSTTFPSDSIQVRLKNISFVQLISIIRVAYDKELDVPLDEGFLTCIAHMREPLRKVVIDALKLESREQWQAVTQKILL